MERKENELQWSFKDNFETGPKHRKVLKKYVKEEESKKKKVARREITENEMKGKQRENPCEEKEKKISGWSLANAS